MLSFSTSSFDPSDRDCVFDGRDGVSLMGMSVECAGGVDVIIAPETEWWMMPRAMMI